MRGRGKKTFIPQGSWSGEPTFERETLERRWYRLSSFDETWAPLVTGTQLAEEPFHRWLSYRQAFAPELVRRFIKACNLPDDPEAEVLPLLDPFCGSGTFAIESARRGILGTGIESLDSLVYLARSRRFDALPSPPDYSDCTSWEEAAERFEHELHRAALICAVARQHTAEGKLNKNAPPLAGLLDKVFDMMERDLRHPLPIKPDMRQGDARKLTEIPDGSVAGILTSPPYLSRHDYTRATKPHEMVYGFWHPTKEMADRRQEQVRSHAKAYAKAWSQEMPLSVTEVCQALSALDEPKLAGVVRSYFDDIFSAMAECGRVLADGRLMWLVIGGARFKNIYIPTDTILASYAESCGLWVESIKTVRKLIPGGRKLGSLNHVAPRESILIMRRLKR